MTHTTIPVVMCFSGLDPTGGAGIQADIEAITSMGCHSAPVITALTIQNTQQVMDFSATDASLLIQQARAILEDMPVKAFKLGMLGSVANIQAIHSILVDYPDVPVVVDPVLAGGGGGELTTDGMTEALINLILPLTTVITPNSIEARALAQHADCLDACAEELQEFGCEYVLITGTHEQSTHVENRLYSNHRLLESFTWERLKYEYHGSGCTLASAIAGLLAQRLDPFIAIHEAQEFTWQSLQQGFRIGMGQHIPNRLFWARGDEADEPGEDYDADKNTVDDMEEPS